MSDKISTEVRSLADIIKENMVEENGAFVVNDHKAVSKAALEATGSNLDEMKRVAAARSNLTHASSLALAETGSKLMGKNKDLEKTTLSSKFGKDKVSASYFRTKQYQDGKGGTVEKQGAMQASIVAGGIKGSTFNAIKDKAQSLMAEV